MNSRSYSLDVNYDNYCKIKNKNKNNNNNNNNPTLGHFLYHHTKVEEMP